MTTQLCQYYRSKRMCLATADDAASSTSESAVLQPGHCWCNKTMTAIGADDRLVSSILCCDAGRPCYRGALRRSAPA